MADDHLLGDRPLVNHIGLTVGDLDASVAFYVDVVGMDVDRPRVSTGGAWFDTLTENSGAVIEVVMLRTREVVLQLVEYREAGIRDAVTGHNRVGSVHLCINVNDVDEKRSEIVAAGRCRPTPIVQLPVPGLRSFYVRDPDGVPVEFIEQGKL